MAGRQQTGASPVTAVPATAGINVAATAGAEVDAGPAPLGPDSLVWRLGFSRASLLLAGRALLLQVAHPVVGAGVRDFSDFTTDPWGRLDRTVTSLLLQLFGGAQATSEADRLRAMHARIRGTGFDGATYSALDPGAWAWVHLSNADTVLAFHRRFTGELPGEAPERFYAEWRRVGAVLGIRPADMPPDVAGLGAHVDEMVATTLRDNPTVRVLLETLRLRRVPAPSGLFPRPLWEALAPLGGSVLHDTTVGTAPPALRAELGIDWDDRDERRLGRVAAAVRAASPRVPDRLLHYPLAVRARRAAAGVGGPGPSARARARG